MITDIKKYKLEYLALITYFVFSLYLYFGYSYPLARFKILIFFILYYFSWSIIHHLSIKKFSFYVFLEYLLISIIGLVTLKVVFFPTL